MGMFDYINIGIECPECKNKVNDFQSKDGPCSLLTLDLWEIDHCYCLCGNCGSWIDLVLKPMERSKFSIDNYTILVRKGKKDD